MYSLLYNNRLTTLKKKIFELRPTQFALGLREVEAKTKKLKALAHHELDDFLKAHRVPVIQHDDETFHLIDHHHLVRACWEMDIEHVYVEIIADLSKYKVDHFWEKMKDSNWVHPYDQFGKGPHPIDALPLDIRGLADDPYRSLAWAIREEGGFEKTEEPFAEFKWADFFRKNITVARTPTGFDEAIKEAIKLAHTDAAKHLPGFIKK